MCVVRIPDYEVLRRGREPTREARKTGLSSLSSNHLTTLYQLKVNLLNLGLRSLRKGLQHVHITSYGA